MESPLALKASEAKWEGQGPGLATVVFPGNQGDGAERISDVFHSGDMAAEWTWGPFFPLVTHTENLECDSNGLQVITNRERGKKWTTGHE